MSTKFYICGAPDDFSVYYDRFKVGDFYYEDNNAYPFIIAGDKLYIGPKAGNHGSIFPQLLGISHKDFNERLDAATKNEDYEELETLRKIWKEASDMIGVDSKCVNGRIYLSDHKKYNIPFNYTLLSFWNENSAVDCGVINKLLNEFNVSPKNVLVADFNNGEDGVLIPLSEWDYYIPEADETQKKARELHLMNAHDKHEATSDFRDTRDKAIYVPREKAVGSMAAYHNMVHTENINKIIRNVLKEYIYKETKRIIF